MELFTHTLLCQSTSFMLGMSEKEKVLTVLIAVTPFHVALFQSEFPPQE